MNHLMYAVRDSAAQTFHPPFCARAEGQATRDFKAQINNADNSNPLYKHPEDFELYFVGVYNDNTGEIEAAAPRMVMRGKDARQEQTDALLMPR